MARVEFARSGFHSARRRREQWAMVLLFLLLMGGFAAVVVLIVVRLNDGPETTPPWAMPAYMDSRAPFGFEMGGVAIGDTPDKVAAAHPEARLTHEANGLAAAAFSTDGASYRVSFLGASHQRRAFRIRYHRVFETLQAEEVLGRIRDRFGQPAMGACKPTLMAGSGEECRYTWWLEDSNRLDLLARTDRPRDGTARTAVTMTVVNTYLEGKMYRDTPAAGQRLSPAERRARENRSLPFD